MWPCVILLVSGPVSVGKTTLCKALADRYEFCWLKTRELVRETMGVTSARKALQNAGEDLEVRTKGRWILDSILVNPDLRKKSRILVDSVRARAQILAIRSHFGTKVVHVHLTADDEVLASRYAHRRAQSDGLAPYEEVRAHPIESKMSDLERVADLVINTTEVSPEAVLLAVVQHLRGINHESATNEK